MSLWEYKIITSGKGGFASPALLEKFLNDLGREEWEIIQFHTHLDNFLVFTGLARRSTQRDWTLEDAAAAAAKAEADKLRAEFEAKFKAATGNGPAGEEPAASFLQEKVAPEDDFRKPIDTSHDADAEEEEPAKEEDDWDKLTDEDELPTFFDAIKPHMRRNQRGPGMSVGVDYLAKKWDQTEEDMKGALAECGFKVPEDEDDQPEYLEFEGDLYWININRRGELWINTKEKPRPVFRTVKAQKSDVQEEPKHERKHHEKHEPKPAPTEAPAAAAPAEGDNARAEAAPAEKHATRAQPEQPAGGGELPAGVELLEKIRPLMRRNRRGPGGSGSASFLSRALKVREADLVAGFKSLGLVVPTSPNEKPKNVEIGDGIWWVNVDSRGNVWINGREKKPGEAVEAATPGNGAAAESTPAGAPEGAAADGGSAPAAEKPAVETATGTAGGEGTPETAPAAAGEAMVRFAPADAGAEPARRDDSAGGAGAAPAAGAPTGGGAGLADIRGLLKETRTGAFAGKIDRLADAAGKSPEDFVAGLVAAGLAVPEKPREKPVFVEHAGEIFWLNRNAKGELWLNAKASKFADKHEEAGEGEPEAEGEAEGAEKKSRRPRSKKKPE